MRLVLCSFLALLPISAVAVPLEFQHQGRLFDALGGPLAGSHELTFRMYDALGSEVWTEDQDVDFVDGYFSLQLGVNSVLDESVFDGGALSLGLTIDSGSELPDRIAVASVPYAVRSLTAETADSATTALTADSATTAVSADTATSVSGGLVDAAEIRINGTVVFDGSGAAHLHDAGDIATGTVDVARLPVGSSSSDVAAGDHVHGAAEITTGVLSVSRLPVGGSASDVAAGDHTHPQDGDLASVLACQAQGKAWGPTHPDTLSDGCVGQRVYATWNPQDATHPWIRLDAALLQAQHALPAQGMNSARTTFGKATGKWYWELRLQGNFHAIPGFVTAAHDIGYNRTCQSAGIGPQGWCVYTFPSPDELWSDSVKVADLTIDHDTSAWERVMHFAVDIDAGKLWIGLDGTWSGSGNPASGANPTLSFAPGSTEYFPLTGGERGTIDIANFGQLPFRQAVPAGFNPGWYELQ